MVWQMRPWVSRMSTALRDRVEVHASAHPDVTGSPQHDRRLRGVGVEVLVRPTEEPASPTHVRVRGRIDARHPFEGPGQGRLAVSPQLDVGSPATLGPERDRHVVLAGRADRAAPGRVRDREPREVEHVGAVLSRVGPIPDREASAGQRHAREGSQGLGRAGTGRPGPAPRVGVDRGDVLPVVANLDLEVVEVILEAAGDRARRVDHDPDPSPVGAAAHRSAHALRVLPPG